MVLSAFPGRDEETGAARVALGPRGVTWAVELVFPGMDVSGRDPEESDVSSVPISAIDTAGEVLREGDGRGGSGPVFTAVPGLSEPVRVPRPKPDESADAWSGLEVGTLSSADPTDGAAVGLLRVLVLRAVFPGDEDTCRALRASSLPAVPSPEGEGRAWAEVGLATPPALAAVFLGVMRKGVRVIRGEVTPHTETVLEPDPGSPGSEAGDSRGTREASVLSPSELGSGGAKGRPTWDGVSPGLIGSLESGVSPDEVSR